MSNLAIDDLPKDIELDRAACVAIMGGTNNVGQGSMVGPVAGTIGMGGGGGISLFSPNIAIQTIVNTPVTVQLATVLEQLQNIDTTNIVNSVLA